MRRSRTVLVLTLILIISAAFGCGCGGKKSDSGKLQGIIDRSVKKMQSVKTFELEFNSVLDAPVLSDKQENIGMKVSANIEDKKNPKYHILFSGVGTTSEAYSIDNYVYVNVPEKGWLKSRSDEIQGLMSVFQLSPSELDNLTDNAQDLKLKSETEKEYVISFRVGPAFFEKALLARQVMEELGSEIKYMVKEISKQTKIKTVFTIDKETMLVREVDLGMDVEDVELLGDIDMELHAVFSNYDIPVEIILPPEAAGAREASPAEIREILEQFPI